MSTDEIEDKLIIGFDLSNEGDKNVSCLIVSRPMEKHGLQILNEFHGKEAEQVYKFLIREKKYKDIKIGDLLLFEHINIFNKLYENANKKILEEFMQYTFFDDNKSKVLVLDKEKIKQKYKVQDIIFEEEDKYYE